MVWHQQAGLLVRVLKDHDTLYQTVDASKGEQLPLFTGYRAVIVLGGPGSANDANQAYQNEIAQITAATWRRFPCFVSA